MASEVFDPSGKSQNVALGTLADQQQSGKRLVTAPSASAQIDKAVAKAIKGRK